MVRDDAVPQLHRAPVHVEGSARRLARVGGEGRVRDGLEPGRLQKQRLSEAPERPVAREERVDDLAGPAVLEHGAAGIRLVVDTPRALELEVRAGVDPAAVARRGVAFEEGAGHGEAAACGDRASPRLGAVPRELGAVDLEARAARVDASAPAGHADVVALEAPARHLRRAELDGEAPSRVGRRVAGEQRVSHGGGLPHVRTAAPVPLRGIAFELAVADLEAVGVDPAADAGRGVAAEVAPRDDGAPIGDEAATAALRNVPDVVRVAHGGGPTRAAAAAVVREVAIVRERGVREREVRSRVEPAAVAALQHDVPGDRDVRHHGAPGRPHAAAVAEAGDVAGHLRAVDRDVAVGVETAAPLRRVVLQAPSREASGRSCRRSRRRLLRRGSRRSCRSPPPR